MDAGLTAVYVGKLMTTSNQHLDWEDLIRVDNAGTELTLDRMPADAIPMPTYESQPEPTFELGLVAEEKTNES